MRPLFFTTTALVALTVFLVPDAAEADYGTCGDGYLDDDEECDDGNTTKGDGCNAHCYIELLTCGDGDIDEGEECDDGGTKSGDGCTCVCQLEEGCTPGYWKQEQHFDSWPAGLTPDTSFSDAFGSDAFGDQTLLEVLETGGGGLIALGRHVVAALLNSESGGVDFALTDDDVLERFDKAIESGDYERIKNIFAANNELGCPLN